MRDSEKVVLDFDARLPETASGRRRQVDVAVHYEISGRRFLRIVEVQDRTRRVGSQFVDGIEGKARALGAHRATIVATAGFTQGAIDRITAACMQLDGLTFGDPDEFRWPVNIPLPQLEVNVEGRLTNVRLEKSALIDAVTRRPEFLVAYGAVDVQDIHEGVVVLVPSSQRVPTESSVDIEVYILGTTGQHALVAGGVQISHGDQVRSQVKRPTRVPRVTYRGRPF